MKKVNVARMRKNAAKNVPDVFRFEVYRPDILEAGHGDMKQRLENGEREMRRHLEEEMAYWYEAMEIKHGGPVEVEMFHEFDAVWLKDIIRAKVKHG